MKAYIVKYKGSWMGGRAVVLAESQEQAIDLVANDPKQTVTFTGVEVEQLGEIGAPRVLYNWNGDY